MESMAPESPGLCCSFVNGQIQGVILVTGEALVREDFPEALHITKSAKVLKYAVETVGIETVGLLAVTSIGGDEGKRIRGY